MIGRIEHLVRSVDSNGESWMKVKLVTTTSFCEQENGVCSNRVDRKMEFELLREGGVFSLRAIIR